MSNAIIKMKMILKFSINILLSLKHWYILGYFSLGLGIFLKQNFNYHEVSTGSKKLKKNNDSSHRKPMVNTWNRYKHVNDKKNV